ncbi:MULTISPECIES: TonB-dependent receptor domain-containing protein [unclassified Arsukibacterium]|uniref:TonB-dependent receptor domain-containing protein n=1 Tax=unclassified Arsukibacterium TaxID=2635278 RepID=UPI000C513AF9|nr:MULTISPECIES: TonB-dependent receptor [unclassified Arsukibacterium]MAA94123.1 TonB-dependent receptor [Rheinheimera sp.]MBM35164.1 TonB-dependent receptor [Rheinheimera sp.]HAW93537.1 TonB-dependent receptor [Candidatus Azambacteria bacterium]|tara:strand:- start:1809 stop:4235 length:2427 start_codon:yes stop_codon:yes gene_type:complete
MKTKNLNRSCLALAVSLAIGSATVIAQETTTENDVTATESSTTSGLGFERIVVTGAVSRNQSVMQSSVSVSSLTFEDIDVTSPRSTAEIFRMLPGVRSESTGGEGNANIAVRGLPVAAGGAKFLTLQEDGLPVLQFGDIAFGNADIFVRADSTMARLDVIRGGSASTAASNSPGGIINFISKTGEHQGGSIAVTSGINYDQFRTDFEFGGDINNDMRFHFGGFVRQGEGVRDPGYQGERGYQIKANVTKEFNAGYVRVYAKHLNDRAASYMPMPMYADGSSVPGYDAQKDTLQSVYLSQTVRLNGDNQISRGDVRDGMNPKVDSFGIEAQFDLDENWTLDNRFRISDISGNFITLFPAEVGNAQDIANSITGDNATLTYAVGPQAGQEYTAADAMRIHTFDVEINDFGSIVNDLKLARSFGDVDVTFGYYMADQTISMSWLWNSYLMALKGDNAELLNVNAADGTAFSEQGQLAYGVPFWGNCCQRNYDTQYSTKAPYINVGWAFGDWSLDASVRRDNGKATGTYAGASQSSRDMNSDGVISQIEQSVSGIDLANPQLVNYSWGYNSYSAGANYQFNRDWAMFGRISKGARANADRLLFGKVNADGTVAREDAIDEVKQYEIGSKSRHGNLNLFATLFFAETDEQNFEATTQLFFDRVYKAKGIELESSYRIGDFDFRGSVTFTDAEISSDALNPDVVGNTPRRQADMIYNLLARYTMDNAQIGVSLVGTTDSYAQDNNDLKFSGYTQINAFANYELAENLTLSLNVNNLFDTIGITEAEQGSVPDNEIITARTINGRTASLGLRYQF